jgi:hypothetical protein
LSLSANADQRSISLTRSEGFPGGFRLSSASIWEGSQHVSPGFPHGGTRIEPVKARSDACKQEQTVNETDQEFRAIQLKVLGDLSGSGRLMMLQFTEITIVPNLLDCYGKF